MMPDTSVHLCTTCTHKGVCFIRRDIVAVKNKFDDILCGFRSSYLRINGMAEYTILKCVDYVEVDLENLGNE